MFGSRNLAQTSRPSATSISIVKEPQAARQSRSGKPDGIRVNLFRTLYLDCMIRSALGMSKWKFQGIEPLDGGGDRVLKDRHLFENPPQPTRHAIWPKPICRPRQLCTKQTARRCGQATAAGKIPNWGDYDSVGPKVLRPPRAGGEQPRQPQSHQHRAARLRNNREVVHREVKRGQR